MPAGRPTRTTPGLMDASGDIRDDIKYYLDLYNLKRPKQEIEKIVLEAKEAFNNKTFWTWIVELPLKIRSTMKWRPTKEDYANGYVAPKYIPIAQRPNYVKPPPKEKIQRTIGRPRIDRPILTLEENKKQMDSNRFKNLLEKYSIEEVNLIIDLTEKGKRSYDIEDIYRFKRQHPTEITLVEAYALIQEKRLQKSQNKLKKKDNSDKSKQRKLIKFERMVDLKKFADESKLDSQCFVMNILSGEILSYKTTSSAARFYGVTSQAFQMSFKRKRILKKEFIIYIKPQ